MADTGSPRLLLQERILECTQCRLHTVGSGPVPFSGPANALYTVVAEAPGREEDLKGQPFMGASGKLLRKTLVEVGLDPSDAFIFNSASCYPNGTPSRGEVLACSPLFIAQFELSGTGPILSLGSTPLSVFRPDLRITKAHGHPFLARKRVVMPTFHPAAILRKRDRESLFADDIYRFAKVVGGTQWTNVIPETCVACEKDENEIKAAHYEDSGLMYCETCWPSSPQGRKRKHPTSPPLKKPMFEQAASMILKEFPGTVVVDE